MNTDTLSKSLRETLGLFDRRGTPMTTSEVTERVDIGRRSTYERLDRLAEAGYLETKKVGASARVWWKPPRTESDPESQFGTDQSITPTALSSVFEQAEVAIFVLDASFEVIWTNAATKRYFGLEGTDVVGRNKRTLIEEEIAPKLKDSAAFAETVLATYDDNTYKEWFECHVLPGTDREDRWLEHHSKPIESGPNAGGRIEIYYDVTQRKKAEKRQQREIEQFDSLVKAVEEYAIFRIDCDGTVQSWNPGAEQIKGYEANEIIGDDFSTFYTQPDRDAGVPAENLENAAHEDGIETEGWRVRKDGSQFWANVTITPIYDDDGGLDGFAKITRDMTAKREQERALRQERDLIEEILEIAPIRMATYNAAGELERVNSRAREQIGLDESDLEEFSVSKLDFYDEDGDPLDESAHPVEKVIESEEPVTGQIIRHDDPDGTHRWISLNASPIFDDDGTLERIVVTGEDLTRVKQNEQALERQRDDLNRELDEMFERVDEAFFSLDDQWQFTYVNDRAVELLERSVGELIGQHIWEEFPEAVGTTFERRYERAYETKQSDTFVEYYPPLERWFEISVYPSESGLSIYFRDISDRKEREQELERYERIIETMSDGVYVIDQSGYLRMVNEAYAELLDMDVSDLIGVHRSDIVDSQTAAKASELEAKLHEDDQQTARLEAELEGANGVVRQAEATFSLIETESGSIERVGVVRDVTDRKQREQELKRYEAAVETIGDGVYIIGDQNQFVMVNDAFAALTGFDREELLGAHATKVATEEALDRVIQRNEELRNSSQSAATIEAQLSTTDGRTVPVEARFSPFNLESGAYGRVGVVRDISARKAQERQVQNRVQQQKVSAELGKRALEDRELNTVLTTAVEKIAATLETEFCEILELDSRTKQLHLREGVGWDTEFTEMMTLAAIEDDLMVAHTVRTGDSVVVEDFATENRFAGADRLRSGTVQSGISTIIGPQSDPWGVLSVQDSEKRQFTDHDVTFVQSIATILSTAISRHETEQELSRQRDELAALNNLNEVVRETTKAVLEQPTQEQIERTVCENLAATDSYETAWIGEIGISSETINVRTVAGNEDALDERTLSIDPADRSNNEFLGRAIRTGEVQIRSEIPEIAPHDRSAGAVDIAAARSEASIPIVHEQSVYGVLQIYTDRTDAFEESERRLVRQLGEVIGHAIASMERKQALLSDEIVELQFLLRDALDSFGVTAAPDGQIRIDQAVQLDDEEFLVYGHVTEDAVDCLTELCEKIPHWQDLSIRDGDGATDFEIRVTEPPVIAALAKAGGMLEEMTFDSGDFHLTVHLSPSTDTREIIETVQRHYPAIELQRRKQRTRSEATNDDIRRTLANKLTGRQRTALEVAYHSGFFEWPREMSGTEVADSLGVAPPTFHQHLRKAERKVLDALFTAPALE